MYEDEMYQERRERQYEIHTTHTTVYTAPVQSLLVGKNENNDRKWKNLPTCMATYREKLRPD